MPTDRRQEREQGLGEIAALSSSALWAIASLFYSRLGRDIGAWTLNFLKCMIALGMMCGIWLWSEGWKWPMQGERQALVWLSLSGILGLTLGDTALFLGLQRLGPRRALLFAALTPAFTALFAWAFLREALRLQMLVGMGLTLAGILWVIRERTGREETSEAPKVLLQGAIWALLSAVCQAAGFILTRMAGDRGSALEMSIIRLSLACLLLGIGMAWLGRRSEIRFLADHPKAAFSLLIAVFLGTFLGVWLSTMGVRNAAHTGVAATLGSTSPLFILPLALFVLRERISLRAILGACLAVCGIAILFYV